ncbi:MAG TPA: glycosyltransferase family 4 protein [Terriglobales bacterium]|nr:glycosyltransferase family 4 protein [Terriglobales bacterium]
MSRVLIVKSNLEPFRVPFYARLQERLAREGVELEVAVPRACCPPQRPPWLAPVWTARFSLAGKKVCWQAVSAQARRADLVIVQQVARELTNYTLLVFRRQAGFKLALWGHGTEFQRSWTTPLAQWVKWRLFSGIDYWFAYTPGVAEIVAQTGYPRERICTVFNSLDTDGEQQLRRQVTAEQSAALRRRLGMSSAARLICYCGSLYKAKRLDMLLAACQLLRASGVDLHVAILGGGAEKRSLEKLASRDPWLHLAGAIHGRAKALWLNASQCVVIPGVVGLAVVDAFVHECPLITTDIAGHGPEIEYLVDHVNGLKVSNEVSSLATAIRSVLEDATLRERLRRGCREAAAQFTLANMVEHFAAGVAAALRLPRLAASGAMATLQ